MAPLRLLSWNLLRDDIYRPYAWPAMMRRPALVACWSQLDFDLGCIQESSPGCLRLLRRLRPELGWQMAHTGRAELLAIAYRRDRFQRLEGGAFPLCLARPADVPEADWPEEMPRGCAWLRLRDRLGGEVVVADVHLAHSVASRRCDAAVLGARLQAVAAGAPVALAGDFNAGPEDEVFAVLARFGLTRMPQRPRSLQLLGLPLLPIDAVVTDAALQVDAVERHSGRAGMIHASDHAALVATLR